MLKEIKTFTPAVYSFLVSTFLMGLSNGMFDAVYNFYLEARGIDKIEIGNIYAAAMIMMACTVIPLIYLSRNISLGRLLIYSSLLYALPFIFLPFITSVVASAFTLGLILSGMISILSIGNSIIGENIKFHTTLFSCFFISYLGAAMVGSIFVSLITYYFHQSSIKPYQGILIASFLSALLMIYFRIKSLEGMIEPKKVKFYSTVDREIEWKNFIILFISALLLGASITLVFRFINIIFNLAYSMNISEISLIMGGDKIISIIGAILSPLFVKRISLKYGLMIIGIMTFSCLFIQSLHIPVVIFILLYFLRLLLNYSLMPLLDTLAITGFSKDRTLISTSVRQLAFYLGSALSAIIYGHFLESGQWENALIFSAVFALGGALFMAMIRVKEIK